MLFVQIFESSCKHVIIQPLFITIKEGEGVKDVGNNYLETESKTFDIERI